MLSGANAAWATNATCIFRTDGAYWIFRQNGKTTCYACWLSWTLTPGWERIAWLPRVRSQLERTVAAVNRTLRLLDDENRTFKLASSFGMFSADIVFFIGNNVEIGDGAKIIGGITVGGNV